MEPTLGENGETEVGEPLYFVGKSVKSRPENEAG